MQPADIKLNAAMHCYKASMQMIKILKQGESKRKKPPTPVPKYIMIEPWDS